MNHSTLIRVCAFRMFMCVLGFHLFIYMYSVSGIRVQSGWELRLAAQVNDF